VTSARINYRFAPLPIALIDDSRIEAIDVLAYGVLLAIDVDGDGVACISEDRLGVRIRRSTDTARRAIRRLEAAGWIEIVDNGNGYCRQYRLTTPSTDATGAPSTDAADPLHPCHPAPSTGATQPIRIPRIFSKDGFTKETTTKTTLDELLELLRRCPLKDRMAEEEADRLVHRLPGLERYLVANLRFALEANMNSPIEYAARQAQRGDLPNVTATGGRQSA
jgi:hypothetical protein